MSSLCIILCLCVTANGIVDICFHVTQRSQGENSHSRSCRHFLQPKFANVTTYLKIAIASWDNYKSTVCSQRVPSLISRQTFSQQTFGQQTFGLWTFGQQTFHCMSQLRPCLVILSTIDWSKTLFTLSDKRLSAKVFSTKRRGTTSSYSASGERESQREITFRDLYHKTYYHRNLQFPY